jgi:hypothetical protein
MMAAFKWKLRLVKFSFQSRQTAALVMAAGQSGGIEYCGLAP